MIHSVVSFLAGEVNSYLVSRTGIVNGNGNGIGGGQVVTTTLVDEGGKWQVPENTLGATLVNIEEERTLRSQVPDSVYVNGRLVVRPPALKVNLMLLFVARFQTYDLALQRLSHVLTFFQARPTFQPQDYPALDRRVEALSLDLVTLGFDQLNQLWAYLGAKYLPSVLYRVRMVALQDEDSMAIQPPVLDVQTTVRVR